MGWDPYSPISLAQVNILCVPVGRINAQKFEEFVRAFRAFGIVSLKNVNNTTSFSSFRDGQILLNIGKENGQDGFKTTEVIGFNAQPQIVIGIVDGEALCADVNEEPEEWLISESVTLQDIASRFNEKVLSPLVVIGGRQLPINDNSYYVDLDGDGPSLFDVTIGIINKFQNLIDEIATSLRDAASNSQQAENDSQSSTRSASESASELARSPSYSTSSPVTGPGSSAPSSQQHDNINVKQQVSQGQLCLLAGQWPEALRHFSDSVTAARNTANHLWHAKSLEGLLVCMLLFAWARLDFNIPQICYPTNDKKSPAHVSLAMNTIRTANRELIDSLSFGRSVSSAHTLGLLMPHLLNAIISLYEQAAGIFQDSSTFKLLCQSRVRWGNILMLMRRHGSTLNDGVLQTLVEGSNPDLTARPKDSSTVVLHLHTKDLTKIFVDAASEAQVRLPILEAAQLQVAVALSLSILGVERKQAFHLTEFLQRLAPALVEARRVGAAEMGIHPAAALTPLESMDNDLNSIGRAGVKSLLESVCRSYGLPKSHHSASMLQGSVQERLAKALDYWSVAHQTGDVRVKINVLSLCCEVADAIPDLQCSLDYMGRLLQLSVGKVTLYGNITNPVPIISTNDQSRFFGNIQKTVSAAARYNVLDARAEYWDKCLVRFVEVFEEQGSNRLMSRTARDLSLVSTVHHETKKDPFIFNPFAKAKGTAGQLVIVVGEQARFNVILQNPLQIDVEIEDIMLRTEGCDFQSDHHSIVLGPLCSQTFILTGTARSPGDLLITGCTATILGCYQEEFGIIQGDWKPPRRAKQLAGSTVSHLLEILGSPETTQISLKVVTPMPKLTIASTSLLQQSLMLLEGEKTTFTLTIRNDSHLEVDFVLITFEDSVTRRLEEALNNKDLLPADMYEIQNQIATRPVVRVVAVGEPKKNPRIPPQGTLEYVLELFGRPGLTDVTILVDYAFLGKAMGENNEPFYTRQLRHTVTTTINGSIDILRCSVLPLDNNQPPLGPQPSTNMLFTKGQWSQDEDSRLCILLLDVRNIWPQPLDVEFQSSLSSAQPESENWENAYSVSEILQPGQMTRVLVLAPRILVRHPYTPIPSLDTKRQFVVSASKMTIEAEAASRESFWYRENLLKCLRATWTEQNGRRHGRVDMRKGIRLNSRMIDALRINLVEITFSLTTNEPSIDNHAEPQPVTNIGHSHFSLVRNKFANLATKIYNHSAEEMRLLLRLQPSLRNQPYNIALDLSKRFAWSGGLQRALHPALKPGQSRSIELGVIALAEGEYEINCSVEEVRPRSAQASLAQLEVGDRVSDRRIWHAQDPCLIHVIDEGG